jgi:HPt (histidine-containing phosphotransfer) domain-containing protein
MDTEPVLPVLNREHFKATAAYLAPDVVATYLRTIAERCESLLQVLRETTRPDAGIAEAAHALAGSAGMFGFERVASTGRLLERAILTNTPDISLLMDQYATSLDATLRVIGEQTLVPMT